MFGRHAKNLVLPLHSPGPIIVHSHSVHNYHSPAASNPVFSVPPLLYRLLRLFSFRLTVSKTAVAALSANDEDDVMSQPSLKLGNDTSIITSQGLLQIDHLRLQMAQYMHVAVWRCEWQHHGLFLNESQRLRVDGIEGWVGRRAGQSRLPVSTQISRTNTHFDCLQWALGLIAWCLSLIVADVGKRGA